MAQLEYDGGIPDDPQPGLPWTGDGSEAGTARLALTRFQRLQFLTSLHPREISVMIVGLIHGYPFDDVRSFSITHMFSVNEVADQWICARYEALREPYVQPAETACRGFLEELRLFPCLSGLSELADWFRTNKYTWNLGLGQDQGVCNKIVDAAILDFKGKHSCLEYKPLSNMVTAFDSSSLVYREFNAAGLVTTQDPSETLVFQEALTPDKTKMSVVAVPTNATLPLRLYPANLVALRENLSVYHNLMFLGARGVITVDAYRTLRRNLRDECIAMIGKKGLRQQEAAAVNSHLYESRCKTINCSFFKILWSKTSAVSGG